MPVTGESLYSGPLKNGKAGSFATLGVEIRFIDCNDPELIPVLDGAEEADMRKLVFIVFIAMGVAVGLLAASKEDWPTRIVMMAVGMLFAIPIGGVLAQVGKKRQPLQWDDDPLPGNGTSSKDLAANYWRDEGHPPFAKPEAAQGEMRRWDRSTFD